MTEQIQRIAAHGRTIAYVIEATFDPVETTFITEREATLQVGFVTREAGGEVPRHDHRPITREVDGTAEVLVVKRGSGIVDFYDDKRNPVLSRRFSTGDVIVLLAGGHGFSFDDDSILLEVKQGPYPGADEKERF